MVELWWNFNCASNYSLNQADRWLDCFSLHRDVHRETACFTESCCQPPLSLHHMRGGWICPCKGMKTKWRGAAYWSSSQVRFFFTLEIKYWNRNLWQRFQMRSSFCLHFPGSSLPLPNCILIFPLWIQPTMGRKNMKSAHSIQRQISFPWALD